MSILESERVRVENMVRKLELMRVNAIALGPAAADVLESIDRQLLTERLELEALTA